MKHVGFQLAGTVGGQAAFDKLVRPAALCRGVTTESEKAGWSEEAAEGNEIDGEEELAAPDWRVRADPKGRERNMKRHTSRFETGACTV